MAITVQPSDVKFTNQYQDWCRLQLQMAHHDIWWTKGQQMKAGSSTLLLLGAVVGASKLLWPSRDGIPTIGLVMLSVLGGVTVTLGILYTWNLYNTMVRARTRAKNIAKLVDDPQKVLAGTLEDPERNIEFPITISAIHLVVLSVILVYFWK